MLSRSRIIPARAGFTCEWYFNSVTSADHPRSRGVYSMKYGFVMEMAGSSPLARGLPHSGRRRGVQPGIIPARAGFTKPNALEKGIGRDHPRSRGVY